MTCNDVQILIDYNYWARDRLLEAVAQLSQEQSTAGVAGASVLWQMLQHVVNHSTDHRGQVTTMLRQLGMTPPKSMDLIALYRERTMTAA
jgi:uncharacterized damage-inducible protein DinB